MPEIMTFEEAENRLTQSITKSQKNLAGEDEIGETRIDHYGPGVAAARRDAAFEGKLPAAVKTRLAAAEAAARGA